MNRYDPESLRAVGATVLAAGWMILAIAAAVSAGMMLTFSNFVMPALGKLPGREAVHAMQRINEDVLNPLFLTIFVGTGPAMALWSIAEGLTVGLDLSTAGAAALYLVGVVGVTLRGNVPLNQRLAAVDADAADRQTWTTYARPWQRWNHARAAAGAASAALLLLGP